MSKLIDSPLEVCPVCDEYVFLDVTQRQCAREHHCENVKCPLARFFVGREVRDPTAEEVESVAAETELVEEC